MFQAGTAVARSATPGSTYPLYSFHPNNLPPPFLLIGTEITSRKAHIQCVGLKVGKSAYTRKWAATR